MLDREIWVEQQVRGECCFSDVVSTMPNEDGTHYYHEDVVNELADALEELMQERGGIYENQAVEKAKCALKKVGR